MNSIQNTACLIAAYETAAGLPDNERITRTDGTWRPGVTEQQAASLYRQAQALLAPETKLLSTSRESLIDQMRDALLSRELSVGDTVLFAATEPYGGPGDFALRGGVIQSIDPERKTCSVQGRFFPMDDVPLHYVLGRYDLDLHETHYGVPCVQPLMGEHPELAERYLREAEARWNTQYGPPAASSEAPKNTMQAMGKNRTDGEHGTGAAGRAPVFSGRQEQAHASEGAPAGAGGAVRNLRPGRNPGLSGRPVPAGQAPAPAADGIQGHTDAEGGSDRWRPLN